MRKYYLKAARTQLALAWTLFWNGFVMNRGHHSQWHNTWFFKHKK